MVYNPMNEEKQYRQKSAHATAEEAARYDPHQ